MGRGGGGQRKGDNIANKQISTDRKEKVGIKCEINSVNCRTTNEEMKGTERVHRKM